MDKPILGVELEETFAGCAGSCSYQRSYMKFKVFSISCNDQRQDWGSNCLLNPIFHDFDNLGTISENVTILGIFMSFPRRKKNQYCSFLTTAHYL